MYITKKDLATLAASALKDPDPAARDQVQKVLNSLEKKREKSNAQTWDYIKKKRAIIANYGRPVKKLDVSFLNQ